MGKQFNEEGCRALECDLKGLVIHRLHAELLNRRFALVDLFGVLDRVENIRIFCRGLRVLDALVGENEIASRYRSTIRPLRIRAQLERVDCAILRQRPAFRRTGNDLAGSIVNGETFIKVFQDKGFDVDRGLCLIERLWFPSITTVQNCFCKCGTGADQKRSCQQSDANFCCYRHCFLSP
ncbi:hypothetical protein D3C78_991920 [compost metagenome]